MADDGWQERVIVLKRTTISKRPIVRKGVKQQP
jgi:hypothetical protein